jgi:thiamine-phosphate pyrophosphorylase
VSQAPQLYLITDRFATAGRSLVYVIEEACKAVAGQGIRVAVQLREKDLGGAELFALAVQLREITRDCGAQLLVNGRVDVALASGADGVHFGHGALPLSVVRGVAPNLSVGVSTHSLDDVRAAQRQGADFVVFGPVFATPSKQGILEPRGLGELASVCALEIPVIALGGVDEKVASDCLRVGATGIAVIRAVLGAPSVGDAADHLARSFVHGSLTPPK